MSQTLLPELPGPASPGQSFEEVDNTTSLTLAVEVSPFARLDEAGPVERVPAFLALQLLSSLVSAPRLAQTSFKPV